MSLEVGRVCVKTRGRTAGKKVVVVDIKDNNVFVIGKGIKQKKCSILHLMPTSKKVDINKGASEKEVVDALEKLKWCGFDECS